MRDPESVNPVFRPNLDKSQETIRKEYTGFHTFLKEINIWKDKKDQRLKDMQTERECGKDFVF